MRKFGLGEQQILEMLLLLLLIIVAGVFIWWKPWGNQSNTLDDRYAAAYDSLKLDIQQSQTEWKNRWKHQKPAERFLFNPNRVDSASLWRMGYTPGQIHGIMNYRRRGGVYKTVDDFNRFGWRTKEDWAEIRSFVRLDSTDFKTYNKPEQRNFQEKKDTVLDLNTADTSELKLLKGIGSGYAGMIVRRRENLGGYASVEQLKEILPEETYEQIKQHLFTHPSEVNKIAVNRSGIGRLKMHPYLNFEQAKALYELRRRNVLLHSINELRPLPEFTSSDLKRLEPYLDFK